MATSTTDPTESGLASAICRFKQPVDDQSSRHGGGFFMDFYHCVNPTRAKSVDSSMIRTSGSVQSVVTPKSVENCVRSLFLTSTIIALDLTILKYDGLKFYGPSQRSFSSSNHLPCLFLSTCLEKIVCARIQTRKV